MMIFPSFFSTCLAAVKFLTKDDGWMDVYMLMCKHVIICISMWFFVCLFLNEVEKKNKSYCVVPLFFAWLKTTVSPVLATQMSATSRISPLQMLVVEPKSLIRCFSERHQKQGDSFKVRMATIKWYCFLWSALWTLQCVRLDRALE